MLLLNFVELQSGAALARLLDVPGCMCFLVSLFVLFSLVCVPTPLLQANCWLGGAWKRRDSASVSFCGWLENWWTIGLQNIPGTLV